MTVIFIIIQLSLVIGAYFLFRISDQVQATRVSQEHLHEWIKYIHKDLNALIKQSAGKEDFELYLKRIEGDLKAIHDIKARNADKRWQTYAEAFGSVPKQPEEE